MEMSESVFGGSFWHCEVLFWFGFAICYFEHEHCRSYCPFSLLSLPLNQEGQLSVAGERMCTKYL